MPGWPRVTREIVVSASDPGTAWLGVAAFGESQILRTRDYGESWQALDHGLPDLPVNVVAADEDWTPAVLYAGTDAGLYRSIDDGFTWVRWGQGVPRCAVTDLRLEPQRGRIILGTMGRGAWSVPIRTATSTRSTSGWCWVRSAVRPIGRRV